MPDWITHLAVAWTLCTLLSFRYKQFTPANTAIVMVGALIPDIYKTVLVGPYIGMYLYDILRPIHLPVGSFIIGGMISLFFRERKIIFLFLALGIVTHYALDLLLKTVSGGIILFYPFYWGQWQFNLVANDDYHISILALAIALVVYVVSYKLRGGKLLENKYNG